MPEAVRTEDQIKELKQKVERLSEENQRLKQQLHALHHTVFGSRTEEEYQGILQTDGYAGYEKVPCRVHALC